VTVTDERVDSISGGSTAKAGLDYNKVASPPQLPCIQREDWSWHTEHRTYSQSDMLQAGKCHWQIRIIFCLDQWYAGLKDKPRKTQIQ